MDLTIVVPVRRRPGYPARNERFEDLIDVGIGVFVFVHGFPGYKVAV